MSNYPIRTSAKAIIIHNDKILVNKMRGEDEDFYLLPGGGQNLNEDLHTTLKRECLEEVGAEIEINNLVFVREYISNNHEFRDMHPDFHQVELIFICNILNYDNLHPGTEIDKSQIGFEWLPIEDLESFNLYPLTIREKIKSINSGVGIPVYVGDVN